MVEEDAVGAVLPLGELLHLGVVAELTVGAQGIVQDVPHRLMAGTDPGLGLFLFGLLGGSRGFGGHGVLQKG